MLLLAGVDILCVALRHGFRPPLQARSVWLRRNSRRVGSVIVSNIRIEGDIPTSGLLVSNHISYVDILVIGSVSPAVFISKSEVAGWPVFGWFATACGTIYVRRTIRSDVARIGSEIRDRLERGFLLVLFPEGTSSDGRTVLPFKSSLLEPVQTVQVPVYAAHVSYCTAAGNSETVVPYWADMTLVPHMIKLLSQPRVHANIRLRRIHSLPPERKELARILHENVIQLAAKSV
jgi:1-acyl-sn-glycerol-3-phosphate acyltransferase